MTGLGWQQCAWVGVGGLVGSVLRYAVHTWLQRAPGATSFPWGTLAVNTLGCLLIGGLAGWSGARDVGHEGLRLFLVVGLFGGFTTFSTFGIDTLDLLRSGAYGLAAGNVAAQTGLGLLAVGFGFIVGRAV